LYMVVAVACSCSRTGIGLDFDDSHAIVLSAFVGNSTKSEIVNNDSLAVEGGFVVWGYKNSSIQTEPWKDTEATQTVLDAVNVKPVKPAEGDYVSGYGSAWTYDGNKYWDRAANYCFYAVAPSNPAYGTYSISGDYANVMRITIDGAVSGKSKVSDDHLICRSGIIDRAGSNVTDNVDISFSHTMAKLVFKVKRSVDVAKLTVTELKMSGYNPGAGKFVQTLTATPSVLDNSEWTIETASTDGEIVLVGTGAAQDSIVLTKADAVTVTDRCIMVPQTIADSTLTFSVKYTIVYSDGTVDKSAAKASVGDAQVWGTDSQTTYTLKVGPSGDSKILFDVASIAGWTNNGSRELEL